MTTQTTAPWRQFGQVNVNEETLRQMESACRLPQAVRGALMPDAHPGYGLPIGGVLALRGAVVPYAVGVDIACRMRLTVIDLPSDSLRSGRDELIAALENETRFGPGANFDSRGYRHHPVMDEDWDFCEVLRANQDRAAAQLGTSGAGNHFVEFGELVIDDQTLGLKPGTYLALLSHSGSRGTGEAVALCYSRVAEKLHPDLPPEMRHLAWLDLDSDPGREYWAAMQLMGRYASANHELIHGRVLEAIGARSLMMVENHHNFAWEEEHDGEMLIVHRKGATPAGLGVLGLVPGSMASPAFVVRGRGSAAALNSCSHGAGRLMSRRQALDLFSDEDLRAYLGPRNVYLISGGRDEAPMAYKDIHQVMAAQADLVETLARFEPRLVKMTPPEAPGRHRGRRMKCG